MLYLFRKDSANNLNLNKQKKEEKDIRSDEYIQYLSLKNLKLLKRVISLNFSPVKPLNQSYHLLEKRQYQYPPKK